MFNKLAPTTLCKFAIGWATLAMSASAATAQGFDALQQLVEARNEAQIKSAQIEADLHAIGIGLIGVQRDITELTDELRQAWRPLAPARLTGNGR